MLNSKNSLRALDTKSGVIDSQGAVLRRSSILLSLILLSGCNILFPEDPREGAEDSDDCASRVAGLLGPGTSYFEATEPMGVPTFTFDITKMDFEAMQTLMVAGSDDTAGTRLRNSTNEESTAVANFMTMSVDENGAFFMGRDPALFRVRGALQPKEAMIGSGCARQQTGMRLVMIDVASAASEPDETSENTNENNS